MFNNLNMSKIVKILTATVVVCFGTAAILFAVFYGLNIRNPKGNFSAFTNSSNRNATVNIDETKTNPVNGIDSIKIKNICADVSIQTYSGKNINAHLYGNSSNNIKLDIKKGGSMLLVEVCIEENNFSFFSSSTLKLDIQIPKEYKDRLYVNSSSGDVNINSSLALSNVKLESSSGNINSLNSIQTQNFEVSASSGNISLDNIVCNKFNIKSTSGTIKCKSVSSKGDASLHSSSGDINLENITAKDLGIETTSGLINSKNVICESSSSYNSTSGDIDLNSIKARDISIDTNSGTVKGSVINAGSTIELSASSGDMILDSVTGNVKSQSTSGNVKINYSSFNSNNMGIDTSSGNVTIGFPGNPAFTLNSKTSSGDIKCDFPITINSGDHEHSLNGIVGNGKNVIGISTTSGNISIIKK